MTKRLFALLLCACMVLGLLPGGLAIPAKADTTGTLSVDKDGKALCPVCNETVTWTPFAGNAAGTQKIGEIRDGKHHHYYLSADVNAKNIDVYFLQLTESTKMCFHLNGHDLYHGGYIMAGGGTVLNIMGSGNVIFTATNTSSLGYDQSGLYANVGSSLTLYGGNYSVAEEALETGKPTLQVRDTGAAQAFIKNAVVQGKAYVAGGTLTLEEGAQVEQIQVDAPGKLYVKSNWTGNAAVSFATALQNNTVPAGNGGCEGAFTGKLQINQGAALTGTADGTLTATGVNADLVLDADSKAFCHVCEQTVTWTAFAGNAAGTQYIPEIGDGKHHHYYLSADVNAKNVPMYFINLIKSSRLCLHLNGHKLVHGGYIMVGYNTVMNIMGRGDVVFTDTNTTEGYDKSGLYVNNSGTLNLYGSTYSVAEKAQTGGKAALWVSNFATSKANIKNAEVQGQAHVDGGTLTLEEGAQLENIQVEATGKVHVISNWTGSAKVTFAAALENYVVPAANGGAEGQFAGKLTLPNGNKLQANASGRLVETGVNACLVPDANSKALCEACHKVVTWTAFAGNADGTLSMGEKNTAGVHYHYYLSADVNARYTPYYLLNLRQGNFCLHLNGHNIFHGGYVFTVKGTILNIMGSGNMIFTATNKNSPGYANSALYIRGDATLYGGTYDVAETALEKGIPTLIQNDTATRILDGVLVKGLTQVQVGSVTLEGSAKLENVQVTTSLILKDSATVTGNATLLAARATVQGPEGLNVTTTAGDTVLYSAGKYAVHNHVFDKEIAAEANLKSEATCTEQAVYYKSCVVCGTVSETETFTVEGLAAHDLEKHDEVPAQVNKPGTEAYYQCKACQKLFSDENGQTQIEEPKEIPALPVPGEAAFNGTSYQSLQTALQEAYNAGGGEVTLNKDITVESLQIPTNVTLDLNGKVLTVSDPTTIIMVYNDAAIIDSSTNRAGRLMASMSQLYMNQKGGRLPVDTGDGIMFAEVTSGHGNGVTKGYQCWINNMDAALASLLQTKTASQLGLKFQVVITWGNSELVYTFSDDTVRNYAANWETYAMYLTVTGAERYPNLTYQARIASVVNGEATVWSASEIYHNR